MFYLHTLLLVNTSDRLDFKKKNINSFALRLKKLNKPWSFLEPFGGFQPLYERTLRDGGVFENHRENRSEQVRFYETFDFTLFFELTLKRGARATSFWFGKRYSGTLKSIPFCSPSFRRSLNFCFVEKKIEKKMFFLCVSLDQTVVSRKQNIAVRYLINETKWEAIVAIVNVQKITRMNQLIDVSNVKSNFSNGVNF